MVRAGAIVLAAAVRSALSAPRLDGDAVSLLQVESAKAGDPQRELAVREWMGSLYHMIRTKQDPLLTSCCTLAKRVGVEPFLDWGKASADQQDWWNSVDCNSAVGANTKEEPHGIPNCQAMSMITSLVPKELIKSPLELYSAESACSAEDRESINSTFLGETEDEQLPVECMPSRIVDAGRVAWDTFATCVRRIYGISKDCSNCYANFLSEIGGDAGRSNGCTIECYGLEACASLRYCTKTTSWCAKCVQPAINKYHSCMGGPVQNQLNLEDIMRKMVHVWGSIY